jgi:hypothetical protein
MSNKIDRPAQMPRDNRLADKLAYAGQIFNQTVQSHEELGWQIRSHFYKKAEALWQMMKEEE